MIRDEESYQLVTEVLVKDLSRSLEFYRALGFDELRREDGFAALSWNGEHPLFLGEDPSLGPSSELRAHLRIVVRDVDECWQRVRALDAEIYRPVGDRDYGLRDFIVLDPDGMGLRFATAIRT